MLSSPSKRLKDKAASAKRTATALRAFAADREMTHADQRALLKAAEILGGIGVTSGRAAKKAKQDEDAQATALEKDTAEARRTIAAWPAERTIDQLALILAEGSGGYLVSRLNESPKAADFHWTFRSCYDDALRNLPSIVAYNAHHVGGIVPALTALREKLDAKRTDPQVIALADRMQRLLDTAAESAR